jgi:hypothetical protein
LGLHGDQLAHSIRGAYGPTFDGKDYLRRFINRRYTLAKPDRKEIVDQLISSCGLQNQNFMMPYLYKDDRRINSADLSFMITAHADIFSLTARDLFEIMDMLETSVAVAKPYTLILPYLLPLIIGHMRGMGPGESPKFPDGVNLTYVSGRSNEEISASNLFERLKILALMSRSELMQAYNATDANPEAMIAEAWDQNRGRNQYAVPCNYPRLISAVSRFSKA